MCKHAAMMLNQFIESPAGRERRKRDWAEAFGMSPSTLSDILSGRRGPTLEQALRIAAATGGAVPVECWAEPPAQREAS